MMKAEVILASRSAESPDLVTMHLRYPRFIHSEIMTHRVFSRNARSSRAVPAKTMLEEIRNDPVVPWHWTKNQPGMQGEKGHDTLIRIPGVGSITAQEGWLWARDQALKAAEVFAAADYHKQIFNRLVEPFMWIDVLVTATEWSNFLYLRDHPDAEPHIRDLAVMVREALEGADYQYLVPGQWHTPYITDEDRAHAWHYAVSERGTMPYAAGLLRDLLLLKISAARCARISYAPFVGNPSIERELERYELLVGNDAVHASPLEHQAECTPRAPKEQTRNFRGWTQFRTHIPHETR